jgi:hypothetical protein
MAHHAVVMSCPRGLKPEEVVMRGLHAVGRHRRGSCPDSPAAMEKHGLVVRYVPPLWSGRAIPFVSCTA